MIVFKGNFFTPQLDKILKILYNKRNNNLQRVISHQNIAPTVF